MHRTLCYNQERIQKMLVGECNFELGWILTKYKDVRRLDPEKGVNKPFENASCQKPSKIFENLEMLWWAFWIIFMAIFIYFFARKSWVFYQNGVN